MADPSTYIVSYNFAGFQANSPTTPLPAVKVDDEFNNIATAVAELVASILDIRRSDGALKNGIVTFDSFEQGLQLMLDPTNGLLVAAAVATAQAAAVSASGYNTSAGVHDTNAAASAVAAAASASSVNLSLYLAKANNLAGLGSLPTSRSNLGLGTAAVLDVGTTASKIVQLDGSAKLPALDGSQLTNVDVFPVGGLVFFPGTSAPTGFLKVNGALISRATYARLYAVAAASSNIVAEASWAANSGSYSTGDLSTTFRLPDARGEFIRGYDDSRGVDSGRVIGSAQADALKSHTHTVTAAVQSGSTSDLVTGSIIGATDGTRTTSGPSTGVATETRPRNIPWLACVKY